MPRVESWTTLPCLEAQFGDPSRRAWIHGCRRAAQQRLTSVPHVVSSGPWILLLGFQNYLAVERAAGGWRFRFSAGWGDCPSGCVHRRQWIFEVDEAGAATFVGSDGDPLPQAGVVP